MSVRLRFCCPLPTVVQLGSVRWTIALGYYHKGHRAELVATSSDGRSGHFLDGRRTLVEGQMCRGFSVPESSVRYRLALALAATGRAVVEFEADE